MSSTPVFVGTPKTWTAPVSTANTNRDGTGTIATVASAGGSGSLIERIRLKADGDPADSTVVLYLHDGSAYAVCWEVDLGNPAAGSATVASYEAELAVYWAIPTGWSLRASITAALTSGEVNVIAMGGDY